jgi:hypothetical protein
MKQSNIKISKNIFDSAQFITPNNAYNILNNMEISKHAIERYNSFISIDQFSARRVISYNYATNSGRILKSYIFPFKNAISDNLCITLDETLLTNKYGIVQYDGKQYLLITIINGPSKYIHLLESIVNKKMNLELHEWEIIEETEFKYGKSFRHTNHS